MAEANLVKSAAVRAPPFSRRGLQERAFAFAFSGLVYPQIWEDPEIDIEALAPLAGMRVATIASGGCNALAYLTEDAGEVLTVDLNPHHVALNRLKHAAFRELPDHETLFQLFGEADRPGNIALYDRYLASALDDETRAYWETRTWRGRRIGLLERDLYRHGLLGRFIGLVHLVSRLHGADPRRMTKARDLDEQRRVFEETLAPVFDRGLVRWLCRRPASLYGLGIPPAQFDELSEDARGDMAGLLRERLRKLACDFPLTDNYFAWQAFARRYDTSARHAVPRYLRQENFETLQQRIGRIEIQRANLTDRLMGEPAGSIDRFVLLDAQDWMDDRQLVALWAEIHRTAAPGARVVFRTAGAESILPGRLPVDVLERWQYDRERSLAWHARDRSAIYGGFHLYVLKD